MGAAVGAVAVLWAGARPASADTGRVTGQVRVTRDGAPVDHPPPVVVYLVGFHEPPPHRTAVMNQHHKHFVPDLLPIVAGQRVSFPNGDPFFHNVFSLSRTRPFDLGQYPSGETKVKRFPRPGVVDVFCNIHSTMSATILVLPNRRFAVVDQGGRFAINSVPPGSWRAYAFSRLADRPAVAEVAVTENQVTTVSFDLDLTRGKADHRNKYGERYRQPTRYRR